MKFTAATLHTESRNTGKNGNALDYELTGSVYYHGRGNRLAATISERL